MQFMVLTYFQLQLKIKITKLEQQLITKLTKKVILKQKHEANISVSVQFTFNTNR